MRKWITAVALAAATLALSASAAFANGNDCPDDKDNGPKPKVTICHSTSSFSNPYVSESPNANSTQLEGHEGHTGKLFNGVDEGWGDIIPDVADDGVTPVTPMNFGVAGKYLLAHDCEVVVAEAASICGPCGDPGFRATFDNSGSTIPRFFTLTWDGKYGKRTFTRRVNAGAVRTTAHRFVAYSGTVTVTNGLGDVLATATASDHFISCNQG